VVALHVVAVAVAVAVIGTEPFAPIWRCHTPGEAGVLVDVEPVGTCPGRTERNRLMKIAVLGANGPIGRLLTQLALDEHHDIRGLRAAP
jgi:hypothetical protein